eukprot:TRINITY_DN76351_c0_g1_i1.p1 TRINITY_DN76351_c0_g1~~TRINITY_DN76351_c0_g1_i1.p1  ORF type:complete len:270 (-),score=35.03 TRINITY_DN76351_c0_g1_i1:184-993(-)
MSITTVPLYVTLLRGAVYLCECARREETIVTFEHQQLSMSHASVASPSALDLEALEEEEGWKSEVEWLTINYLGDYHDGVFISKRTFFGKGKVEILHDLKSGSNVKKEFDKAKPWSLLRRHASEYIVITPSEELRQNTTTYLLESLEQTYAYGSKKYNAMMTQKHQDDLNEVLQETVTLTHRKDVKAWGFRLELSNGFYVSKVFDDSPASAVKDKLVDRCIVAVKKDGEGEKWETVRWKRLQKLKEVFAEGANLVLKVAKIDEEKRPFV